MFGMRGGNMDVVIVQHYAFSMLIIDVRDIDNRGISISFTNQLVLKGSNTVQITRHPRPEQA